MRPVHTKVKLTRPLESNEVRCNYEEDQGRRSDGWDSKQRARHHSHDHSRSFMLRRSRCRASYYGSTRGHPQTPESETSSDRTARVPQIQSSDLRQQTASAKVVPGASRSGIRLAIRGTFQSQRTRQLDPESGPLDQDLERHLEASPTTRPNRICGRTSEPRVVRAIAMG